MKKTTIGWFLNAAILSLMPSSGSSNDWMQFRGAANAGISQETNLPIQWSNTQNLAWMVDLPGPGSSSPIAVGDRVFVTCYSGYGVSGSREAAPANLQRHVVCVDRRKGTTLWTESIAASTPEDSYQGYLSEHGYASSTPVTDGKQLFCFFGKSGLFAYDLNGRLLWQAEVGKESSNRRWGSAASPILYQDLVIVNASEESRSLIAFDKATGKQRWKAEGAAMELAYGTPVLATAVDGRMDLVIAVPGELWGLNPETGKMQWYAEHTLTGNVCPSLVTRGNIVYVFGGFRSAGSFAARVGGKGDVTHSSTLWSSRNSSYVATPVLYDDYLFWISDSGLAFCTRAKDGELVYRERVPEIKAGNRPVYASPVAADGKLYVPTRWDGTLVISATPEFKVVAHNRFDDDDTDFNGSIAISNGQLFIRSNRRLYCVASNPKD